LTPPLEKHLQFLAETVHLLLVRHGKRCDSHKKETGIGLGTVDDAAGKPDHPPPAKKPATPAAPQIKRPTPTSRATPSAMPKIPSDVLYMLSDGDIVRATPSALSKKPSGRPQTAPPMPVIQETMKKVAPDQWRKWRIMWITLLAVVLVFFGTIGVLAVLLSKQVKPWFAFLVAVLLLTGSLRIWWYCQKKWLKWWFEPLVVVLLLTCVAGLLWIDS
jgi:membrane protein YdbS with pleckstrin-like domain